MDDIKNLKLLAQHRLNGHGNLGEGMSMQLAGDGRRILWLAHESAPVNFTGVDVSDPREPKVIVQTMLPHANMRSNSLETVGDVMAVAYQCSEKGMEPAGIELLDISRPEDPRRISFIDCSGPHSRGAHQLWFVDGETIHAAAGSADFTPRRPKDDQFYRIYDVRDLSSPKLQGEWWMPGTREGDHEQAPEPLEGFDYGCRVHNTNVYPERPDRAYLGYINGGFFILDIADRSDIKVVSSWNHHPPFKGFTHTVLPLFERDLLVVSDEAVTNDLRDWPKFNWVFDASHESRPVPISTLPIPAPEEISATPVRYGAHNLHENRPGPAFRSDRYIFGTYFAGGLRVHDLKDPFRPEEIAWFIPEVDQDSTAPTSQINDVFVDDRGVCFCVDRIAGGLHMLELDF